MLFIFRLAYSESLRSDASLSCTSTNSLSGSEPYSHTISVGNPATAEIVWS